MSSKICAIFGYGPGLGAACARKWASEGFKIAIMSRTLDKVVTAETEIPNCKGFACDVTKPEDIENTVQSIEKELGPIHTVVYNAGSGVWSTFDKIEMSQFDAAMKTNTHGLLKTAQVVAPLMLQRGQGNILITGATASLRGKPFTAGFAPAKGAQRLLAQSLARDLGPKGIHVAYFINDGVIGSNDSTKIDPTAIADTYWFVSTQPKICWTFELDMRPNIENW
jgi:NAD(P)-dependent dehydrogenase (short-subunit alcohol dehydrogenase family)